MQNLIATTFEVVHYIALQAVHYKPLQEVHLSRYNHSAPMQAGVLPLAVPGHGIRMSRRIHVTSVLVKRHPIDAVRFCESCHIYCITYTNV